MLKIVQIYSFLLTVKLCDCQRKWKKTLSEYLVLHQKLVNWYNYN